MGIWRRLRLWLGVQIAASDDRLWSLVDRGTSVERVATGFRFTEGPVWCPRQQCLYFSDIPADRIWRWTESGDLRVFKQPSGKSNGLCLDRRGRIIACEHETRRVTATAPDGTVTVLAASFRGKRLNSPNDVVVHSDGTVFFTDPPYGIKPHEQEQPVQGVYKLDVDGHLELIDDGFDRPNGLAFSPDEHYLYIADSSGRSHLRRFEVQPAGSLEGGEVILEMNVDSGGCPDGLKVDASGNLFCTGPDGIWILDSDGVKLGTILLPERPANCAWGGPDGKTLYITARTSLYRVQMRTGWTAAAPFE